MGGWLSDKIIQPDLEPAIYVYRIFYREDGREKENLGFFALGKLEEYLSRGVAPHENILPLPREGRLKLRLATQADFGPVYMVYSDKEKIFERLAKPVLNLPPLAASRGLAGERHQLWALTDEAAVGQVAALLASRPVLIADGHHRYDAALESFRQNSDKPWFAYRMAAFFNAEGDGLSIRPIHRLLLPFEFSTRELLERLSVSFEVKLVYTGPHDYPTFQKDFSDASRHLAARSENRHRFRLLLNGSMHLISCAKTERLDVAVLERTVFREALGLTDERLKSLLAYSTSAFEAAVKVEQGKAFAGFLLDPPTIDEIWRVVQSGQKLPPKSTFFYPKLLTGLVMNINAEFYK